MISYGCTGKAILDYPLAGRDADAAERLVEKVRGGIGQALLASLINHRYNAEHGETTSVEGIYSSARAEARSATARRRPLLEDEFGYWYIMSTVWRSIRNFCQ